MLTYSWHSITSIIKRKYCWWYFLAETDINAKHLAVCFFEDALGGIKVFYCTIDIILFVLAFFQLKPFATFYFRAYITKNTDWVIFLSIQTIPVHHLPKNCLWVNIFAFSFSLLFLWQCPYMTCSQKKMNHICYIYCLTKIKWKNVISYK